MELRDTEGELSEAVAQYEQLRTTFVRLSDSSGGSGDGLGDGGDNNNTNMNQQQQSSLFNHTIPPPLTKVIAELYPPVTATATAAAPIKASEAPSPAVAVTPTITIEQAGDNKKKAISWGDTPSVVREKNDNDDEKKANEPPPPPPSAPMTALEKAFLKKAMSWGKDTTGKDKDTTTTATTTISQSPAMTTTATLEAEPMETIESEAEAAAEAESPLLERMKTLLKLIQGVDLALVTLTPRMDKFAQRLAVVDPVTGLGRYGTATRHRVTALLQTYAALQHAMHILHQREQSDQQSSEVEADKAASTSVSILHDNLSKSIQSHEQKVLEEERSQYLKDNALIIEKERQEQARQEEQKIFEQEQLAREEASRALLASRAEQHRLERAEAERQVEISIQRARAADQAFMDSIVKGEAGMKTHLNVLEDACGCSNGGSNGNGGDYKTAISALHTIFKQIIAQPEEVKFRRIRRDHVQFTRDIGRHRGGHEFLIAAGFRYVNMVLDENDPTEIAALVSKEPNLETDMDGWADWFDTNKKAVQLLEEAITNMR
jgi:hypothetical protein